MKTIHSFLIFTAAFLTCFFSSCKEDKTSKVFLQMEKGFDMSNKAIQAATGVHYRSVSDKRYEAGLQEQMKTWYPVTEAIRIATGKCLNEVKSVKDLNKSAQQKNIQYPMTGIKNFMQKFSAIKEKCFRKMKKLK